jgi:hypothetical protein
MFPVFTFIIKVFMNIYVKNNTHTRKGLFYNQIYL